MNVYEAIIEAFKDLGGERSIAEIRDWIDSHYPNKWVDISTALADMIRIDKGGNASSNVNSNYRLLVRVSRGIYRLVDN